MGILAIEDLVGLVAVGGSFVFVTAAAIAHQIRKTRLGEYDAHLKRTMLERGMSVDEIERVLSAGKKHNND